MKNSIRCCISCILPCGALDVIRIVHANGRVEEISGTVKAAEIMKAHPKHVLKKPSSPSEQLWSTSTTTMNMCPKIVIVPPDAQLQRGKIYFLMPMPQPDPDRDHDKKQPIRKKKKKRGESHHHHHNHTAAHYRRTTAVSNNNINGDNSNFLVSSDRYLTEILSENKVSATQRDRRRGRAGVWRPHLESISETPTDAYS